MNRAARATAVVLDRHPLWHEAVEHVLHRLDVRVVGKATSPAHALRLIESERPNLLVTGITMDDDDLDGVDCLREALELVPDLNAIVLSMGDDPLRIDAALEAGASAYVLKDAPPEELADAIRRALDQTVYPNGAPAQTERSSSLTRREREILMLLSQGHSNAQLAKLLWVTEQTIKFHLSNIYRKLNVSNRTEAAHWARLHGLLEAQRAFTS